MIEWYTYLQLAIAVVAGLLCLALGLAGRKPTDVSMGATLLVEVLLIVQLVVAIVAPFAGNEATGSVLEFYTYLISAILLPLGGGVWALIERSRWSTVILGLINLSVAVMLYRMLQIWTVQGV
ncbi:MAG: hypothetical protein ABWY68_05105 [Cryobacterium sp.]